MEKIKLTQIAQEVAGDAFKSALATAKPKLKEKTDAELAEILGLSNHQYKHFVDKALGRAVSEKIEEKIAEIFKSGHSIEVPHQFQVYVHESKARLNEDGSKAKKLSVRTRRAMKDTLNQ